MSLSRIANRDFPLSKTAPLSTFVQLILFLRSVYISDKMDETHRLPECSDLKV